MLIDFADRSLIGQVLGKFRNWGIDDV